MQNELKPCPFCGGKARYVYSMPFNAVKCPKCKIFGPTVIDTYEQADGKEESIQLWNRRANNATD
jgi:Lar family restriction alleviation protein